jgi:hypothetical protein
MQTVSFADYDYSGLEQFLNHEFLCRIKNAEYMFFERGRASFCTSMNGVIHGHGHLIPYIGDDDLLNMFPFENVRIYNSLAQAYAAVSKTGEYMVWGIVGDLYYVCDQIKDIPKRLIRSAVLSRLD